MLPRILLIGETPQPALDATLRSECELMCCDACEGDALETIQSFRPDALIVDDRWPGSESLCLSLRALPAYADLPLLWLIFNKHESDRVMKSRFVATDFFFPEQDPRELLRRVQATLRRKGFEPGGILDEKRRETLEAIREATIVPPGKRRIFSLALVELVGQRLRVMDTPESLFQSLSKVEFELSDHLRRIDSVAAYDEKSFVVMMPETDEKEAFQLLSLVRRSLAKKIPDSEFSIGFSCFPADGETLKDLVSKADLAVSEASVRGNDRVFRYSPTKEGVLAKKHILVIDDDPFIHTLLTSIMRLEGFQTTNLFDGQTALEWLQTNTADLMVVDIMMPRLDGFGLLEALNQRNGGRLGIRAVILTSIGQEQNVVRAFELGAFDYITKPFSQLELRARIKRALP